MKKTKRTQEQIREKSRYEPPGRSARHRVLSHKIKKISEKAISHERKSTLKNKPSKEKILRNYDKSYLSEPEYSTHHIAKKKIIKPSTKSFLSRTKAKI